MDNVLEFLDGVMDGFGCIIMILFCVMTVLVGLVLVESMRRYGMVNVLVVLFVIFVVVAPLAILAVGVVLAYLNRLWRDL